MITHRQAIHDFLNTCGLTEPVVRDYAFYRVENEHAVRHTKNFSMDDEHAEPKTTKERFLLIFAYKHAQQIAKDNKIKFTPPCTIDKI